jgi:hypothetical protein
MLIDLSLSELAVIRQALRSSIDMGDHYFMFAPDRSCGGAKVFYGSGDIAKEDAMAELAKLLLGRIKELTRPETLADKMAVIREVRVAVISEGKVVDKRQVAMKFKPLTDAVILR